MSERGTEHEIHELRETVVRVEWAIARLAQQQALMDKVLYDLLSEIRERLSLYPRTTGGGIRVT